MPINIKRKTTFILDVKIPSLDFEKEIELDDESIVTLYEEVKILHDALASEVGAVNIGNYSTPTSTQKASTYQKATGAAIKLREYARTHTDFTVKCASEALNIPAPTLYIAAIKLIEEGFLTRTQVLGGIEYIYTLSAKQRTLETKEKEPEKVVVLPNGKVPVPPNKFSIEREKMESLK